MSVMTPGGRASSPMSMKRNDAPQIAPTATNNDQSIGVNSPSAGLGVESAGR